ncbi:MAG: hypothetical protein JNL70_10385 [Saprospiraceae bacterium]|nr:hypothetical protein [Saprospiraceae bacterium]
MKNILILLVSFSYLMLNAQSSGTLTLQFDNMVGNEDMVLNTKNYKNAMGEDFNISLFQYYVSNIRLMKSDGSEYAVPQNESYFLIREQDPKSQTVTLNNVPKGKYTGIRFVIGIDSLRNTADISQRKGCLDVGGEAKDMYWAWNSGYIFVKMEGTSPVIELNADRKKPIFMYHIGLFGGMGDKKTLNNIKETKLSFGSKKLKVKDNTTHYMVIKTDASHILNGSTNISIAKNPSIMAGPFSAKIADNYNVMFSFGGFAKSLNTISETKTAMK